MPATGEPLATDPTAAPGGVRPRALRILVADADPVARGFCRTTLTALGHQSSAAATGRELLDLFRTFAPDLIIAEARLPDGDGLELAAAVCRERPVPVVLASATPDTAAVWAAGGCRVLGYLTKPFTAEGLGAAVAVAARNFDHIRALEEEVAQARQALEERKVIERAKGAVMRYTGASEEEAYTRMRRLATDRGQKLAEVARSILAAGETFEQLTRAGTPGGRHPGSGNGRAHSPA